MQTILCPVQNFTIEDLQEEKIYVDPGSFVEGKSSLIFVKLGIGLIIIILYTIL